MKRRQQLLRRSLFPLLIALLAGLVVGVGVAGLPDPEALNPVAGRPPLTVKPGVLLDPSEFTVPPLLLTPDSLVGTPGTAPSASTSTTTSTTLSPLRNRADLRIAVSNANGRAGTASTWATNLGSFGYGPAQVSNSPLRPQWVIYFADGFEAEAKQLADDLATQFLNVTLPTAPLAQAPVTDPPFEGDILLVVGQQAYEAPTSTTTP